MRPDRLRPVTPLTDRDRALLAQLAEHEPLATSELLLLFFTGPRTCRQRLMRYEGSELLLRVYPAAGRRGTGEALWFLTAKARLLLAAPTRRTPSLSLPDLEHRRAVARFYCALVGAACSIRARVPVLARRSLGRARHRRPHPSRRLRPLPPSRRRGHLLPRARSRDRAGNGSAQSSPATHARSRPSTAASAQDILLPARAGGGCETSPPTPRTGRPGSGAQPTASGSAPPSPHRAAPIRGAPAVVARSGPLCQRLPWPPLAVVGTSAVALAAAPSRASAHRSARRDGEGAR